MEPKPTKEEPGEHVLYTDQGSFTTLMRIRRKEMRQKAEQLGLDRLCVISNSLKMKLDVERYHGD